MLILEIDYILFTTIHNEKKSSYIIYYKQFVIETNLKKT